MKFKMVIASMIMTATSIVSVTAMTAGPAAADPGTCGVRNWEGPTGSGVTFQYIVRNQCSRAVNMKIKANGHWLYCKSVPANGYAGWTSIYVDQHWSIGYC